ncbi:heme-binding protein [Embleya sp. NPDC008237]|uniref:GlcG/HbpS family heme-binding protein n=1 Tax=Embleya sp. NPDC008237 TaxID=3363978 RepID=UPI0036E03E02
MSNFSTRGRVLTGVFSLAAVGAVTAGVAAAQVPGTAEAKHDERPAAAVVSVKTLGVDAASKAAQAALDAAEKDGQKVTVVVVARDGSTRVVLKGDGAGPQSEESARRKAYTAVSWNAPTSALAQRVTAPGASLRDIPGTLFLAGAVPVAVDGAPIVGIGVAGAPGGDLDEKYAAEGLKAIAGQLK